uniref:Amiloride-sensitive sodium channel n=1 Tax=Rhabditophanes sp. KR3021 TaxID=114890 RepID=A0AC35TM83_9BILA
MGMLEVQDLLDLAGFNDLIHGEAQLERYNVVTNSTLNINRFINDSGYECQDLLKICSVNGKIFDCCKAARPLLNSNGRCYEIDIHSSNITWLQKPVRQGLNNGLLVIAEYHQEESLSLTNDIAKEALFGDVFQNGFKYSIHESKKSAIFSSEDVSISPGTRVFSAVSAEYYSLLSYDDWGNCTRNWPEKLSYLQSTKPYSASDCKALCQANYFVEKCECSPFSYNVEGRYKVCTPYQLYDCLSKDYKDLNIDIHDIMPACKDCRVDCETWQYSSSNSFGGEFPTKALSYITQHNSSWSPELISQNFIAVNVFFKENSYRVYEQIKGTTISECLSNIGGCLGLFLGLSIISLGEMFVYFTKIFWVFLSKRRRNIVIEKERSQSMNV